VRRVRNRRHYSIVQKSSLNIVTQGGRAPPKGEDMNEKQRKIVRQFIGLHNEGVRAHLRLQGMLNHNGTLPRNERAERNIESWFLSAICADNYTSFNAANADYGKVVSLEIDSFNSSSGNPVIFEFDGDAWPHLIEESWTHLREEAVDETGLYLSDIV
jgi:hypothetical protein